MPPRTFELDDGAGLRVAFTDLGATWLSCRLALPGLGERELMPGRPRPEDHVTAGGFVGSFVGRYANRIAGSRFTIDGRESRVVANEGANQLHGGPDGFHRRRFELLDVARNALRLRLVSPDGDQGFPGELTLELDVTLPAPGELRMAWRASCTAPCPVNPTSHAYFNLDGDREGMGDVSGHRLRIAAAEVLPVDGACIPTGELMPVAGTRFDFRAPRSPLGPAGEPYDHCWRLAASCAGARAPAAELISSDGRVAMVLSTTLPGLQFYAGEHLAGTPGRDGRLLPRCAALALEPQYFPDSPNRPGWPQPSCILRPGQVMAHEIVYRFERR